MNAPYDFIFFKDPYIVNRFYDVLRCSVFYMPECFNPIVHKITSKYNPEDYECDITTAGNLHPYRVAFFKNLIDLNLSIKIWGFPSPNWLDSSEIDKFFQQKPVHDSEKVAAFRGAKIVVNNLLYSEVIGLNVRAFEIAGAGAFQLIDNRIGISDLFEDGVELVTFSNVSDLKKKIKFYLNEPDARAEIAAAGYKAAIEKHTYASRLRLMIDTIFNNGVGYPTSHY